MESPAPGHRPRFDLFFNSAGRLRSGWRLTAFVLTFLTVFVILLSVYRAARMLIAGMPFVASLYRGSAIIITERVLLFLIPATLIGWALNRLLEDLPPRALGWTLHRGWLRDAGIGISIGALSLALAVALVLVAGGYSFSYAAAGVWPAVLRTLALSGLVFIVGAAAEEATFRGYPLQTLLRSLPVWVAVIPSSLLFATVHLSNPHVVEGFTFLNTALAGVWLAVAYTRTRSLWFPLGVHFGWNWALGPVLGLPVSGITSLTRAPIMRATDNGPAWLTGGAYGIEGGTACTVALIVSTLFLLRTRLVSPDEELKAMTDRESTLASGAEGARDY
ncbi:MAG TPA: type II CAAX endopeptidase family protein [Pyrinomonadaceae bacterium]|nr:type II CAAX endopeptidase family protein [Pyrinomonadaceae bacterium]